MHVAIIDVGSNNIKLEIHEVDSNGHTNLQFSDKVAARLGHEVFLTHKLAQANCEVAYQGLKQFARIISNMGCKKIIAVGTAALRETDSAAFVEQAFKESGIQVQVISGIEEARYVYAGVLAHTSFDKRTFFLNDIGGGSTEISVAGEEELYFVESLRLGTVRLKEMFINTEGELDTEITENYVNKVIGPYVESIKNHSIDMGLCTGGTARNLVEIISARLGAVKEEKGIPILATRDLKALVSEMKKMSPKEIAKLKGLDEARADIILPGGILLLSLLEKLDISQSLVSPYGLRDGLLMNYIYRKINKKIYRQRQEKLRHYGLNAVSKKYNLDLKHAQQTAALSLRLFELLETRHGLNDEFRDILYGAALLHDVGAFIDYSGHHKHSFYLISNANLLGFGPDEQHLIAVIARYHRKSEPKQSHQEYQILSEEKKDIVNKLSAILRLADAFDRSYNSAVKEITLAEDNEARIIFRLEGRNDLFLEEWSFSKKKHFFEKTYNVEAGIELTRAKRSLRSKLKVSDKS